MRAMATQGIRSPLSSPLIGLLICIVLIVVQVTQYCDGQQLNRSRKPASALSKFNLHTSTVQQERELFSLSRRHRVADSGLFKITIPSTRLPSLTTALRGDQAPPQDSDDELGDIEQRHYHNSDDYIQEVFPLGGRHDRNKYIWSQATTTPMYQQNHRTHRPQQRVHPCEQSSCYPATGNLLIGRENRLYASSTCGINGPERFCIVSHLEEKKCFLCDTRPATENEPLKNHRVGQIIYKNQPGTLEQSWWQSEYGKENVSIQLDLEAEFHFTHLIIEFATFRPAAMLIERSYDFGKTWHVYKYFAHNCHDAFPHAPRIPKNITDVVCDQRYSGVEPSKHGEVIFRVLPPNMNIENPYAEHVQNMLKMTNLRINFTRLHTLGDTLLDDRQEIQEKYYYAISNMVVRGSCSCYGHASRCLPLDGVQNKYDMVHGRCECTHNTKGLNCEECEDFFNDYPWKPALGKQTNACKKCTCHNHATSCHFDQAVYEHSGRVSGGVCDNCQHNTQGQHCEECIPFFYKDPNEDIQSPTVCKACDCDPSGSLDDGICDSVTDPENNIEAGACHCKVNVKGRRCDTCKDGFWQLNPNNTDGCKNCTCNTLGTINNSGCNMYTGECTCKRLVTGKDCNQCMPETYGLSDSRDGCSLCNCDAGGSLDNHCDVITGQCRCRSHMTGRSCNNPLQNHFVPSLHKIYEAELFDNTECNTFPYGNCSIIYREQPHDRIPTWSGPGFIRAPEGTELTFTVDDVPKTMNYDVVVRYSPMVRGDWEVATITLDRPHEYDPDGVCANSHPDYEKRRQFSLPEYNYRLVAMDDVCLEHGKIYKFIIKFERQRVNDNNPAAYILVDSLTLIPRIEVTPILSGSVPAENRLREYDRMHCNESYYDINYDVSASPNCRDLFNTIGIFVFDGATPCNCNPTGSTSKKCEEYGGHCQCKPNIVGRQCDKCAPGTYGFGPEGCKACDCNSIGAQNNDCDLLTGQCLCYPNTYGRECNQCQPGFWNFPDCQQCECNGHTQTCDSLTGDCQGCQDYTTGNNCERCVEGFYGNSMLGSEIGCRPCRCPDTIVSGHSHADQCELNPRTNDMVCYCREGYAGARCDICADNFYGNPDKPGGVCKPCECGENIDLSRGGNCDSRTGKCLQCLYDTDGEHCESCRDGFYGNALRQECQECRCSLLGTNSTIKHCDKMTGQCPCLPNVKGLNCDECIANHWKIASGEGCEECACDPIGSISEQCNSYTGQCNCREAFGGRQCDQCQANFWGNPNEQCKPCDCNLHGSSTNQCDRETGQCKCNKGIGGYRCDMCDRGYLGEAPYCSPCGECFDNWDLILNNLEAETTRVIAEAKQIKTIGATGAYTKEFDVMTRKLDKIRQLLDNTTVSTQDINDLEMMVSKLRTRLNESLEDLQASENTLSSVYTNISLANVRLDDLRNKSNFIKSMAHDLKENATKLQEANIEGALNLTRDAWQSVNLLSTVTGETQELNTNAERQCKRTETLVNRTGDSFAELLESNNEKNDELQAQLDALNGRMPNLNEQMCGKASDSCDALCGGAGCKFCGGLSCEKGAMTRAEKALNYAKDTEKNIKEKEDVAEDLIRSLSQAKTNASDAYQEAMLAHESVLSQLNITDDLKKEAKALILSLTDAINNNTASPDEIKSINEKTLEFNLQLNPDAIKQLADQINETVSSLGNVDSIIANTKNDLDRVEELKNKANDANNRAEKVLETATEVVNALNETQIVQAKARAAIDKANKDISSTQDDLDQIDGETGSAQLKANETAEKVEKLTGKLNELQKNFLKNDVDSKSIKDEADAVMDSAENAYELAIRLQKNYKLANDSLTERALTSEKARKRAQNLLQRASQITVDTKETLKELQSMAEVYKTNDRELENLQERLNILNGQMNDHLTIIQKHSDRYRQCTS